MWQLPPLLSTLPDVHVVAATGQEHRAVYLETRGANVVHPEALVQARLVHALIAGLTAMIMGSRAALCHGPGWPR